MLSMFEGAETWADAVGDVDGLISWLMVRVSNCHAGSVCVWPESVRRSAYACDRGDGGKLSWDEPYRTEGT